MFVCDASVDSLGAAPKWRMGLGLAHLIATIEAKGGRVLLRKGDARVIVPAIAREVGATSVHWGRLYDKDAIARDTDVKSTLKAMGVAAHSHAGHLLFEPWTVETKTGGYYKVYSPFWRAVKDSAIAATLPMSAPTWAGCPDSDTLDDWALGAQMRRGAAVVAPHCHVGEEAALARLDAFIARHVDHYKAKRDFPAEPVCSGLSENLTYGEISPRTIWHAGDAGRWRRVRQGPSISSKS